MDRVPERVVKHGAPADDDLERRNGQRTTLRQRMFDGGGHVIDEVVDAGDPVDVEYDLCRRVWQAQAGRDAVSPMDRQSKGTLIQINTELEVGHRHHDTVNAAEHQASNYHGFT